MINVKVAYEHKNLLTKVEEEIEKTIKFRPSLWGEDYTLELDDYTWIDHDNINEPDVACLLSRINNIIEAAYQ